jgi:hypothetical protein
MHEPIIEEHPRLVERLHGEDEPDAKGDAPPSPERASHERGPTTLIAARATIQSQRTSPFRFRGVARQPPAPVESLLRRDDPMVVRMISQVAGGGFLGGFGLFVGGRLGPENGGSPGTRPPGETALKCGFHLSS